MGGGRAPAASPSGGTAPAKPAGPNANAVRPPKGASTERNEAFNKDRLGVGTGIYGQLESVIGTGGPPVREPTNGDDSPIDYGNGVVAPYLAVAGDNNQPVTTETISPNSPKDDPKPFSAEVVASAKQQMAQAMEADRAVTPALMQLAKEGGGQMVGLTERVKSEGSMARKIEADAQKDKIPADQVTLKDAVRYTMNFSPGTLIDNAEKTRATLESQGYTFEKVKNTWDQKDEKPYRGINAQVTTPDGYTFELQFHTPESFMTKENNHEDFELHRLASTPDDVRQAAEQRMVKSWENVTVPVGYERFGTLV